MHSKINSSQCDLFVFSAGIEVETTQSEMAGRESLPAAKESLNTPSKSFTEIILNGYLKESKRILLTRLDLTTTHLCSLLYYDRERPTNYQNLKSPKIFLKGFNLETILCFSSEFLKFIHKHIHIPKFIIYFMI